MNERDVLAEGFEANRTHLRAVTYRMLGSVSEADDAEMYLHPQAQRYFHRLLAEMADCGSCRVLYATHSPIFVPATRFETIRLVRKDPGADVARLAGE